MWPSSYSTPTTCRHLMTTCRSAIHPAVTDRFTLHQLTLSRSETSLTPSLSVHLGVFTTLLLPGGFPFFPIPSTFNLLLSPGGGGGGGGDVAVSSGSALLLLTCECSRSLRSSNVRFAMAAGSYTPRHPEEVLLHLQTMQLHVDVPAEEM